MGTGCASWVCTKIDLSFGSAAPPTHQLLEILIQGSHMMLLRGQYEWNGMWCVFCGLVQQQTYQPFLFHWVMVDGAKELSCPYQHGAHGAVEGDCVWDSYGTHGIFQVAFFWVWRDWVHFKNEALKAMSFRLSDSCISLWLTVNFSGVQASSSVNALTVYVYARIYSIFISF